MNLDNFELEIRMMEWELHGLKGVQQRWRILWIFFFGHMIHSLYGRKEKKHNQI